MYLNITCIGKRNFVLNLKGLFKIFFNSESDFDKELPNGPKEPGL